MSIRTYLGIGLILIVNVAWATPFNHHGVGARATAMSNAFSAVRGDFANVYYNPAGLTGGKDVQFGLGFDLVVPQLKIKRERQPTPDDVPTNFPSANGSLHAAALFPLLSRYDYPLALGIGVSLPLTNSTRIEASNPETPQFYRYDAHSDSYALVFGIGGRVHEWVSIGAGIHLLGGIDGAYDIELDLIRRRFTREVASATFEHVFAWSAGLTVHPSETFSFALAYRDRLQLDYRLDNQTKLNGIADFDVQGYGVALYVPPRFVLGARWVPMPDLTLTFDLLWERWSQAPDPSARVIARVDGSPLGLDETVFTNRVIDLASKDTLSPRFGAEWNLDSWVFRGGYAFVPATLPAQTGLDNYADSDAHQVSLGAGIGWGEKLSEPHKRPVSIEVSAQAFLLEERLMPKTEVSDPIGSYTVDGLIWYCGLTMRHRFE